MLLLDAKRNETKRNEQSETKRNETKPGLLSTHRVVPRCVACLARCNDGARLGFRIMTLSLTRVLDSRRGERAPATFIGAFTDSRVWSRRRGGRYEDLLGLVGCDGLGVGMHIRTAHVYIHTHTHAHIHREREVREVVVVALTEITSASYPPSSCLYTMACALDTQI